MGAGQTARVDVRGVACLRGDRLLFEGLDLTLAPCEAAMVTGPNGAGKSSLLRILAGLLRPVAGNVTLDGDVALAAEATALDERRTLGKALAFWAGLDGSARLAEAMAAMGIANLAAIPVHMLSTGQRKRAVLARTIASGAGVWLLDEPANGLDTSALDALAQAMAAHRAGGGIVVAASHVPLGLTDARAMKL